MNRRSMVKAIAGAIVSARLIGGQETVAKEKNAGGPKKRTPSGGFITTDDGASLFYRDWGAGLPIVFVHAWTLSSDFWEYQMAHFTNEGFRCVGYDRRSHGRSSDPGRGYDYDRLADDLATLIETLDLREMTLVGHSMGGGEVIRYLSRHGSRRVARAVLIAPTAPLIVKTADFPDGIDKTALDGMRAALIRDRAKWVGDNTPSMWVATTSPEVIQWGQRMTMQCSLKAMLDTTHSMTETDFRAELRRITVPTLFIHGNADRSVGIRFGRLAAGLIPGCRFVEYEGAPHALPITHMDRLNQDLLAFMKG